MSIFIPVDITCPACGLQQAVQLVASVNAVRRPDLRQAMLDRTFQAQFCEACEEPMRLPLHMTFLDMNRGVWLLAHAFDEIGQWEALVAEARAVFDESFGPSAPQSAQELAEGVAPRVVFGWPALREKIICNELGLDDVTVELIKAALWRGRGDIVLEPEQSLRLAGRNGDYLVFEIADDRTEKLGGQVELPAALHDDIKDDPAWDALRQTLLAEPFVDLRRLTIDGTATPPPPPDELALEDTEL